MLRHSVMSNSCDPMDCSPQGSSARGILQARILEWIAMPFSRGSSWPRDRTRDSYSSGVRADSLLLSHQGLSGFLLFLILWTFRILTCVSFSRLRKFSVIISSNKICAPLSLPSPSRSPIIWMLGPLMLFHIPLSCLHNFFILSAVLIAWVSLHCLHVKWFFLLLHVVCCWIPLVYFFLFWIVLFLVIALDVAASLVAQLVKKPPTVWETPADVWVGSIPWRRDGLHLLQ